MRRAAWRAVVLLCGLVALVYTLDFAIFRYKNWRGTALGSVIVYRYYAIEKKANRVEYQFVDKQDRPCAHSLFGHAGLTPCWYLEKHTEQRTNI